MKESFIYVKTSSPGIKRLRHNKRFHYYDAKGQKITDEKVLERIKSLAIPPAYTKVWICPIENGHIQAIGRDIRKRKQYIYHPLWVQARDAEKYKSLMTFGASLVVVREKILEEISKKPSLHKEQIICTVLYLIDKHSIRVGSSIYAKDNQTYGITTLRKKHLSRKKNTLAFNFIGKNNHPWVVEIDEKNIIKILDKCTEVPGYELFKYYDDDKQVHIITAQDINEYLFSLTQEHFTAKDFRTWIATREFFSRLIAVLDNKKLRQSHLKTILLEVSTLLGHTPTICKSSYIHPEILSWLKNGQLQLWKDKNKRKLNKHNMEETLLLWLKDVYS